MNEDAALLELLMKPFEDRVEVLRMIIEDLDLDSAVLSLIATQDTNAIALAFDTLSVACEQDGTLLGNALDLADRYADAPSEEVRWSVAQLLASRDEPLVRDHLSRFALDADSDVRWQVAFGLPDQLAALINIPTDDPGVVALLTLMTDIDLEIRELATFGIATADVDGPVIRNALMNALLDSDGRVKDMALVGLARREDERAWPALAVRLRSSPTVVNLQAAEIAGNAVLCDALLSIRESNAENDWQIAYSKALQACCGDQN